MFLLFNKYRKIQEAYEKRREQFNILLRELLSHKIEYTHTHTHVHMDICINKEEVKLLGRHIGKEAAIQELYYPLIEKAILRSVYE